MSQNLFKFNLITNEKQSFINIDKEIKQAVEKSGIMDGVVIVFCPHTTGGITINENADPDVKIDLKKGLNTTFPNKEDYVHMEGNSDGHMKSSVIGVSETLILSNGKIVFGTWQSVYFCEFDGPRNRLFFVKILKG